MNKSVRPLFESLESRRLMSSVIDLRVAGGGNSVTVTSVGQVVNLEIWMTITGADASGANEALQSVNASLLSTNIGGGAVAGTLSATKIAPFNATASQDGAQVDLDGDGDLDVGSNVDSSATGYFLARSATKTVDGGVIDGASKAFKVGTATFTVTALLNGAQTNLVARTRNSNVAFVLWEDDVAKRPDFGGVYTAGSGVILKRPGTASISGRVFNDKNANGIFDGVDTGISGFRVFLDKDADGVLDAGETSKPVSTTGTYTFSGVEAGTYRVREVFRSGWRQTYPALGYYELNIGYGQVAKSLSFANTDTVLIKGTVFMDADKDGKLDAGEPGLPSWTLYVDADNDGVLDTGELSTLSDANGNYRFFNIPAGTYIVRAVPQAKFQQTAPAGGFHTITLAAAGTTSNKNFGEKRLK